MSFSINQFPFKLIDLTHTLSSESPSWDGDCGFEHQLHKDYEAGAEYQFRTHKIHMHEGMGTHIDAPAHCRAGGRTIAELEVNELLAPCAVIDVSAKADENYVASLEDVKKFEESHGLILSRSFVIFYTGWDKFWQHPQQYRNNLRFPSVGIDAATFLLNERNISGLGIDTLSPDNPKNGYPVHKAILGNNKFIVENIANAGALPPTGAYSLCLPIKVKNGTEAPMRLVALLSKRSDIPLHTGSVT